MSPLRSYIVPFVLAVLVHVVVGAALWANWAPDTTSERVIKPRIVKAELLVMQPKAKPAPPKPQPAPPQAKPEVKPPPKKPEPKPVAKKTETPKPDREAQRRAEEAARRAAALERLSDTAFADALLRESEAMSDDEDEQAAMSFIQGIYSLVVANWSRPPSARNDMEAHLVVELVPTGDVVSVTVVKGSGNEAFDRSAMQAVRKAGKFDVPKEPALFEAQFRRFNLMFKPGDLLR